MRESDRSSCTTPTLQREETHHYLMRRYLLRHVFRRRNYILYVCLSAPHVRKDPLWWNYPLSPISEMWLLLLPSSSSWLIEKQVRKCQQGLTVLGSFALWLSCHSFFSHNSWIQSMRPIFIHWLLLFLPWDIFRSSSTSPASLDLPNFFYLSRKCRDVAFLVLPS